MLLQPSPLSRSLSSHCSAPTTMPSPHALVHTLGEPTQLQPASSWQVALQPLPSVVPPSSQPSPALMRPLPQLGAFTVTVTVAVSVRPPSVMVYVKVASPTTPAAGVNTALVASSATAPLVAA